jgi:hypothetical protein
MKNLKTFEEFNPGTDLDMIEEGWFSKATPEELREKGLKNIKNHRIKYPAYLKFKKEDEDKANKYLEFWGKYPQGNPVWSTSESKDGKAKWVDHSKVSASGHVFGAGA